MINKNAGYVLYKKLQKCMDEKFQPKFLQVSVIKLLQNKTTCDAKMIFDKGQDLAYLLKI